MGNYWSSSHEIPFFGSNPKLGDVYCGQSGGVCARRLQPVDVKETVYSADTWWRTVLTVVDMADEVKANAVSDVIQNSKLEELYFLNNFGGDHVLAAKICFITRNEACNYFENDSNESNKIVSIDYGVTMLLVVDKMLIKEFPELRNLLKTGVCYPQSIPTPQKLFKCQVLVSNNSKPMELTLLEACTLINSFIAGRTPEYETAVKIGVLKYLKTPTTTVPHEFELVQYLEKLYICSRILEDKLRAAGYSHFVQMPGYSNPTLESIMQNLTAAKKKFDSVKNSANFFELHPVLKSLFWNFQKYLEFMSSNGSLIDQGALLGAGADRVFEEWASKLEIWSPLKIGDTWFSSDSDNVLVLSRASLPAAAFVENWILEVDNNDVRSIKVVLEASVDDFFLNSTKIGIKGVFGFVDMNDVDPAAVPDPQAPVLQVACPQKCSPLLRKWLCTKCGAVVKCHQICLYCSCGMAYSTQAGFCCASKDHLTQFLSTNTVKNVKKVEIPEMTEVQRDLVERMKVQLLKKLVEIGHIDGNERIEKMKQIAEIMGDENSSFDAILRVLETEKVQDWKLDDGLIDQLFQVQTQK